MKILRLSTFLDFGGIESKMVNLSSLEDVENEWVFVALGKGGQSEKKIQAKGKRTVCLHLNHKIPSLSTIWKLFLFLKKEKPDVLHTSGAEANFFGFFAGKLAGVKTIVVEEIGIPNHSSKAKKIFQYIFKKADWVVGESKIVVDNLIQTYKLNPLKTKVIHNFGIFKSIETRKDLYKIQEIFKIIMISRLEPVKNIEGVLNVVKRLKNEGREIRLSIAGKGSIEGELKNLVQNLEIHENVDFLGLISDPYPHLLEADLYVLNSHSEGFSNSLVEAMYSKTPSLSTSVGAAPEIIKDGVNGFLVPADNEEALFLKVKEITQMSAMQRKQIGEAGHKTIIENFSLENHVEKLMEIYKA
ncbi:MAG: hypothetical protein BGO40_00770 [Chryseobacterium sp. 39-10]|nr:glycosyltransferase family 4 protein [Chryseobacterium sp.]OJV49404.1 MAG: hypothetical protein BGO40_00770 [Chryseobacterium sp. 39-10]